MYCRLKLMGENEKTTFELVLRYLYYTGGMTQITEPKEATLETFRSSQSLVCTFAQKGN